MAKLYFRYGAMNSGKSTALMQVAHNYEEQGMQVLILKPQVDTKGGGELVSRLGVHRKADRLIRPDMDVFEVVREASQATKLACVLCVPRQSAMDLSDELVRLGIQGFWNFSHYDLSVVYPQVTVENVHLGDSLMSLGYRLRNQE